eukprot:scaffold446031_cov13-Prasinocladus_malaysianus.AAC.1
MIDDIDISHRPVLYEEQQKPRRRPSKQNQTPASDRTAHSSISLLLLGCLWNAEMPRVATTERPATEAKPS